VTAATAAPISPSDLPAIGRHLSRTRRSAFRSHFGANTEAIPTTTSRSGRRDNLANGGKTSNLPSYEKAVQMTVSELIDQLRAMPPDATVMLWSRMDDPQHRRVESVELSTTKSDPTAEVVVLS
jgi:hypothetical protein